jgi:hypothetical protein
MLVSKLLERVLLIAREGSGMLVLFSRDRGSFPSPTSVSFCLASCFSIVAFAASKMI